MKKLENQVYFEDTDSVEAIKQYFTEMEMLEKKCETLCYGDLNKNKVSIDSLIEDFNKTEFFSLSDEEKNTINNLLKREKNNLDNLYENVFEKKFSAFLSLLDYVSRNNELLPHNLSFSRGHHCFVGSFEGVLGAELESIQSVVGSNPISFYCNDVVSPNKNKLPKMNCNLSLDSLVKVIKENFVADMGDHEFDAQVKKYKKYKDTVNGVVVAKKNSKSKTV